MLYIDCIFEVKCSLFVDCLFIKGFVALFLMWKILTWRDYKVLYYPNDFCMINMKEEISNRLGKL